jgi:DNA-binding NarL/FixJ family response regulator
MKILIVDDHDVIRQSMGLIIQAELPKAICTKLENAESCIELLKKEEFDLIILDLNLPDMDGISLTEWIKRHNPQQMILIFSMNPTSVYAKKLYQMGVMGYLNKQADMAEIQKALRTVLIDRKQYINDEFRAMQTHDFASTNSVNPFEKLSKQELIIAQLLAQGKKFDEIANQLKVESSTIRTYKSRIFQKLEVNTVHDFLSKVSLYKFG